MTRRIDPETTKRVVAGQLDGVLPLDRSLVAADDRRGERGRADESGTVMSAHVR
jgi:hypothetical protein